MSGIMDQLSGSNWRGWERPDAPEHQSEPEPADILPPEPAGSESSERTRSMTDPGQPSDITDASVSDRTDPLTIEPEPDDLDETTPIPSGPEPITAETGPAIEPEPEPAYDWTPDSYSGDTNILAQLATDAAGLPHRPVMDSRMDDTSVIRPLPDEAVSAVETLSERLDSSDEFDDAISGRRPIDDSEHRRSKRIPVIAAAVALAVAAAGSVAAWGAPRLMERHAMAECAAALEAAEASIATLKTNRRNAKSYAKLNVKDETLIAKLNRQLKQSIPTVADCPAADAETIGQATQTNLDVRSKADSMSNKLAAVVKRVAASQDEKTLQDARDALRGAIDEAGKTLKEADLLNDSSEVEVLKTRLDNANTVLKAKKGVAAIGKATSTLNSAADKVEQAIRKKKDSDAKAKAEEEAKRKFEEEEKTRQEQQAATQQTPSTPRYVQPRQQYVSPTPQTQQPAQPAQPTPTPAPKTDTSDPGNNGVIM